MHFTSSFKTLLSTVLLASIVLSCGKSEVDKTSLDNIYLNDPDTLTEDNENKVQLLLLEDFPKAKAFSLKGPIPRPDSSRYWDYTEVSLSETLWNHRTFNNGIKSITIYGKHIVLSKGHPSRLHEKIDQRRDIKNLTIHAETVEIQSSLSLPSTNVVIKANNFRIAADAVIDLSAPAFETTAATFANGQKGLDSGSLTLLIENTQNLKISHPFLLMNGGKGQNAGPGQKGADGISLNNLGNDSVHNIIQTTTCDCHQASDRAGCRQVCSVNQVASQGIASCPSSGSKATPGGMPGQGGNPGMLMSNLHNLNEFAIGSSGESGNNAGQFMGGNPGSPSQAYHQVVRDGHVITRSACAPTYQGESANSPSNPTPIENFKMSVVAPIEESPSEHWSYQKLYAEDLYLLGHIAEAQSEFKKIAKALKNVEGSKLSQETQLQLAQIDMQKDFFGNHSTWIPGVSFELTNRFYRTEMENAFNTLYLTQWLLKEHATREAKAESIFALQNEFEKRLGQIYKNQQELAVKRNDLNSVLSNLKNTSEVFEEHLTKIQAEIEEEAQRNVHSAEKKAKLKRALLGLTALAKVFPAGQPALAGVGTSVETLLSMSNSQSAKEAIGHLPTLYQALDQAQKFEESRQHWNTNYHAINYRDFLSMNSQERKEEIEKTKNFYKPVFETLKEQYSQFKAVEMGTDAISAEVKRIQATSPRFQEALGLLTELNKEKQQAIYQLQALQNNLMAIDQERMEIYNQSNEFQKQLSSIEKGLNPEVKIALKELSARVRARMLKYKYYLAKAYQYRLLKPFPGSLDLFSLEEKINQIIQYEKLPNLSHQELRETYSLLYQAELSSINFSLFESLDHGDLKEDITEVSLALNQQELEAISNGKTIFINTRERDLIPDYHRNARLLRIDIDLNHGDFTVNSSEHRSSGFFDITVTHTGTFVVEDNDNQYLFSRPDLGDKGLYHWGTRVDLVANSIIPYQSSPWVWSLFNDFSSVRTGSEPRAGINELYARPGLATILKLKLNRQNGIPLDISLKNLNLKLHYSFKYKE